MKCDLWHDSHFDLEILKGFVEDVEGSISSGQIVFNIIKINL